MSDTATHTATTKRIGSPDYGHVYALCSCGWKGSLHSRRMAEGRRLADRDALDHSTTHNNA